LADFRTFFFFWKKSQKTQLFGAPREKKVQRICRPFARCGWLCFLRRCGRLSLFSAIMPWQFTVGFDTTFFQKLSKKMKKMKNFKNRANMPIDFLQKNTKKK
jgi:hypothetical protein